MNLSVVIPAYNEQDNIKQAVLDVWDKLTPHEIIVVDDSSTDNTRFILHDMQKSYGVVLKVLTNLVNSGHGYSVVRGLKAATGDSILYVDADRQIDLENFHKIPKENLKLFDFITGIRVHRNDKLFRKVISVCLRMTILLRFNYFIKDSNCPFKVYRREALQPLLAKVPESYVIPIACLEVLARKEGLMQGIIPTPHHPYQGDRKGFLQSFNLKMYKFLWSAFWEIVKL